MADINQNTNIEENKEVVTQPQEKLIPQSEVNIIVGREKKHAAEKATREAKEQHLRELEELKRNQEAQNVNAIAQKQDASNAEVGRDINYDQVYQQLQERFYKDQQAKALEMHVNEAAKNYLSRMGEGKSRYSDFEDVTGAFNPTSFPNLVYLVSGMDNAADIIYDLSKNPSKLVTINTLSKEAPDMARAELLKLSNSITENLKAVNEAKNQGTNSPLSQIKPSLISGNNGKSSIRDLRAQKYLRG